MFSNLVSYIISILCVWGSAELIISGVEKIYKRINISAFTTSFYILGILTSIPEFSIGLRSVLDKKPEIYAGDLIGGSFVMFFFIIPLLAVAGNGIKLSYQFTNKDLIFALFISILPIFFVLDGNVNEKEAILMIVLYIFLLYFMNKKNIISKIQKSMFDNKKLLIFELLKVIIGSVAIYFFSRILVDKTIYFASFFHISSFFISLLVLSVGTNIPELFIGIRSVVKQQKEVAFGDYVGSAVANTLLFGIFTVVGGSLVLFDASLLIVFVIFVAGLILFYAFTKTNRDISRKEGLILLIFYVLFLVIQLAKLYR